MYAFRSPFRPSCCSLNTYPDLTLSIEYPGQIDLETSFGFLPYVRYRPIANGISKANGVIDESKKTA